jgi:hypothetical protein
MATSTGKTHCVTCGKGKAAYICVGCSKYFCFQHLAEHRQVLEKQLDDIENERNLFRQTLIEQKTDPLKHPLIQQIDKWERDSIKKIRKTAEESKQLLVQYTQGHVEKVETKLANLTENLKQTRQENDINEIILNELEEQLIRLKKELVEPPDVSIQYDSSPFVTKIAVVIGTRKFLTHIFKLSRN